MLGVKWGFVGCSCLWFYLCFFGVLLQVLTSLRVILRGLQTSGDSFKVFCLIYNLGILMGTTC